MPDFMQRRRWARLLDRSADRTKDITTPEKGWIHAMRQSLGLPADVIAARKGVTRAAIYQAERSETEGAISLKQMERIAQAMGGRFVYAIVPDAPVESIKYKQALQKARHLAQDLPDWASQSPEDQQDWIEDKAAELLHDMPSDFWADP